MKAFVNARVYGFDSAARAYTVFDALVVDGSRIVSVGSSELGASVECVNLEGATVVPAFADCHVHLTDTGYTSGARDLSGVRSYGDFADRIASLPPDEILLAGNYDESTWSDGARADSAPLERFLPERLVMLVRVDGHSCLVNRKTLEFLNLAGSLEGLERGPDGAPTGTLFLEANWRAQATFLAAIPETARRAAEARALELALSRGALHLHVQLIGFAGREGYAREIASLAGGRAKIYPKICERDPGLALSLDLPFIGGDVFLDGSIGSGTAAMSAPYCDRPGNGRLALADDDVRAYFAEAERLGVSAGVHAIGDRAIEQCLATWEDVLGGQPSPRNRHFIEHFEVATTDQIERCARLGIYLSMQPQFDELWGGAGRMYETRLGRARMQAMNALATALRAGATLCGGDDSPVCELSPLRGMDAAVHHHTHTEALTPLEALTMYTYDAARLGHVEASTGSLGPGMLADFVVLDRDPMRDGSFAQTRVLQTWRDGACVFEAATTNS